jgi:adenylate kinase family enzyme
MTAPRCVIVAGVPGSGTSRLAKGLSFAPGFTH